MKIKHICIFTLLRRSDRKRLGIESKGVGVWICKYKGCGKIKHSM